MKIDRNFAKNEYVKHITGKEFRDSGALWFINSILHLFGLAITWNPDTDELRAAIVKYRGFSEACNDEGYEKLSRYLGSNIEGLKKDFD